MSQDKPDQHASDALDLLATSDVCDLFGIAPRTLQTWRQLGHFPEPDLAVGKTLRWRRSTLERWLAEEGNPRRRQHSA